MQVAKVIKRWQCCLAEPERYGDGWATECATMEEAEEGEYVCYSDHQAAITALEQKVKAALSLVKTFAKLIPTTPEYAVGVGYRRVTIAERALIGEANEAASQP